MPLLLSSCPINPTLLDSPERQMVGPKITKGLVEKHATKLRFPILLGITGTLFVLDLLIPDFIPFVDEILLGLATVILSRLKTRKASEVFVQEPDAKK